MPMTCTHKFTHTVTLMGPIHMIAKTSIPFVVFVCSSLLERNHRMNTQTHKRIQSNGYTWFNSFLCCFQLWPQRRKKKTIELFEFAFEKWREQLFIQNDRLNDCVIFWKFFPHFGISKISKKEEFFLSHKCFIIEVKMFRLFT